MLDDRQTLINSLRASKGWTTGYATAFVDNFGDKVAASTSRANDSKWSDRFETRYVEPMFDRYPYIKKS